MELCNEKLRKLRMSANMTQEQMADEIGMSYSNYNRLESGNRKIKMEHIAGISKAIKKEEQEVFKILSTHHVSNTINNPHDNHNVVNIGDNAVWEKLLSAKDDIINQKDKIIALLEKTIEQFNNRVTYK